MTFLERILNWMDLQALLDILLGPELDSKEGPMRSERPHSNKPH